jgi:hypothetical protein
MMGEIIPFEMKKIRIHFFSLVPKNTGAANRVARLIDV